MYRLKKIMLILLLSLISQKVLSQKSENKIYLLFDNSSMETYNYEIGNGKIRIKKVYNKVLQKNKDIIFYIYKEKFYFKAKEVDTCKIECLRSIKISDLKKLKKEVNKRNSLYPYKVFPNLYLVEKINDSIIVKYKVKWEYYIE